MGYGIIAVPTGIVTSEMTAANVRRKIAQERTCSSCGETKHEKNAKYCKTCGEKL
jgi:voltage-gated potassium channel